MKKWHYINKRYSWEDVNFGEINILGENGYELVSAVQEMSGYGVSLRSVCILFIFKKEITQ